MGYLLSGLTKGSLDNQIDVVRNERRQNYDNQPYRRALFAIHEALYPDGHPYRYLTIGKHEDLECASVDDVERFFATWYVPANATLALVGDFDVPEAKRAIEHWFGAFPASVKPTVVPVPAPVVSPHTTQVDDSLAKLRQLVVVWHSPASFTDGDAELDIAANALAAESTGRLYRALVYDKQLAQSVRANQAGAQFSGTFTVTITLRSGSDLAETQRLALAEVERLAREPLDGKEIARVVAAQEAGAIYQLENLNQRANTLQAYNHYLGDPDRLSWDLDRYRKTTAEKVRATVARYLTADHAVVVITNPGSGAAPRSDAPATCGGGK
jgi:zinc protease